MAKIPHVDAAAGGSGDWVRAKSQGTGQNSVTSSRATTLLSPARPGAANSVHEATCLLTFSPVFGRRATGKSTARG